MCVCVLVGAIRTDISCETKHFKTRSLNSHFQYVFNQKKCSTSHADLKGKACDTHFSDQNKRFHLDQKVKKLAKYMFSSMKKGNLMWTAVCVVCVVCGVCTCVACVACGVCKACVVWHVNGVLWSVLV